MPTPRQLWNALPATDRAVVASFLRVLTATALATFLGLHKAPDQLSLTDLKYIADAVVGAAGLTLVNYFRAGETRFGLGSQ